MSSTPACCEAQRKLGPRSRLTCRGWDTWPTNNLFPSMGVATPPCLHPTCKGTGGVMAEPNVAMRLDPTAPASQDATNWAGAMCARRPVAISGSRMRPKRARTSINTTAKGRRHS